LKARFKRLTAHGYSQTVQLLKWTTHQLRPAINRLTATTHPSHHYGQGGGSARSVNAVRNGQTAVWSMACMENWMSLFSVCV